MEVALECNYQNALGLLRSRKRKGRPTKVADRLPNRDTGIHLGILSLYGMGDWLRILGHSDSVVNSLNVVHIAGTKGKGSTCAFTRSFLRTHGARTGFPQKIGLYTSPDLRYIRERIQINDQPITEQQFAQYFFEVYEKLIDPYLTEEESPAQPRYLQLLALLAFHTFIREGVDAAIFETHSGGEYDVTNVVQKPVVTGITSLGFDHVIQLGQNLDSIAWHKAGIFKAGIPAFSVPQDEPAAEVLYERSIEKGTTVTFVPVNKSLPMDAKNLSVPVQRVNCSLALELARTFIKSKAPHQTLETCDIIRGIDDFQWMGRFEIIQDEMNTWFLDGAHNTMKDLARALSKHKTIPDRVIITTNQPRLDGTSRFDKNVKIPKVPFSELYSDYASRWKRPTVEGAILLAKEISNQRRGAQILVTGSIHLVGGALDILRPQP
ncbi:putative tetrahydrofolylpolyglutamate synthase [Aspergillus sclerotioniger CBS 115572]|uniref:tetrahydrofolate synthase n=1 Tax=Aspergillus sclerotioniger CBS 115572 TaxID=1450535 RepID=A0A317WQ91_9EURO|nr:putative tetrahydrofolylpolyglutamate synthase [Aspergillus sclerotioniger CBS 115572]PWY88566.1 putative tetrahydrofolylpolyglutamate synthase [Aspergillus sclerotioniger CBS 115572]